MKLAESPSLSLRAFFSIEQLTEFRLIAWIQYAYIHHAE